MSAAADPGPRSLRPGMVEESQSRSRPLPDRTLSGDALLLRPVRLKDVPGIVAACTDGVPQTWLSTPYTEVTARSFVTEIAPRQRESGAGLVRAVEVDGRFAGATDLTTADRRARTVEVGYGASPRAGGRGAVTRVLTTLSRRAIHGQGFVRVEVRRDGERRPAAGRRGRRRHPRGRAGSRRLRARRSRRPRRAQPRGRRPAPRPPARSSGRRRVCSWQPGSPSVTT